MSISTHIISQKFKIGKAERIQQNRHKPCIIWFTGLSGSGKSTLANAVEELLMNQEVHTYVLDGDNIRLGINRDLDFSAEGRKENIRRIGEVAKLFVDAGVVVLTAFISPFKSDRAAVRSLVDNDEFVEVFVDCPLDVCEQRDVKGLYKKARAGEIADFTGISSPFEKPEQAEITVHTDQITIEEAATRIANTVLQQIRTSL